jgi:hypothetical protein
MIAGVSRHFPAAIVLAVVAASGTRCARRTAPPPPPAAPVPAPVAATLREKFRPPAEGRLTALQVEEYLAVQDRLRLDRRRGRSAAPGDALELVPADVAAARERHLNVEEYTWVKERVLEADAALMTVRLNTSVLAMLEKTIAELKARRAAAPDEGSRKLLSEQLAQFEVEADRTRRESHEKESDVVRVNMKVIEPYRARLSAAADALRKADAEAGRQTPTPGKS